jgi:ABC-type bacteriocin/lantibiotic exporter with double-glycine peptidase domain
MVSERTAMITKISRLLSKQEKTQASLLLVLIVFAGFLEMVNLGLLIPFMALLTKSEITNHSEFIQSIYAHFEFQNYNDFLIAIGCLLIGSIVLSNIIRALAMTKTFHFTYMRDYSISKRLFEIYLGRPYDFFLTRNSSDLSKNILNEVGVMVGGIIITGMQVITKTCVIGFILLFLLIMNPQVTISISLVFLLFYGGIYFYFHRHIEEIGAKRHALAEKRFHFVKEAFANIKQTKIYNLENEFLDRYDDASKQSSYYSAKQAVIGQLPAFVMEALGGVVVLSVILFYSISTGGDFVSLIPMLSVYLFAGYRLLPNVQQLFAGVARMRFTMAALNSIEREFVESGSESDTIKIKKPSIKTTAKDAVTLNDVSYAYPSRQKMALDHVSFTAPRGQITAIIGKTGSGKTTLIDLILGLIKPEQGTVSLFDQSQDSIGQKQWFNHFAYVSQNVTLFDDSLAYNIALKHKITTKQKKAMNDIISILDLEKIVDDLNGLDGESIGENGQNLSGGQRQRISIARALFKNPDILIFDEATSALDIETEAKILKKIRNVTKKTIIFITHSDHILKYCDNIVTLSNGKIK